MSNSGVNASERPLQDLFSFLRRAGLPLGVGEYLLALETLRAGEGLESLEQLRFTCRLLWAKSLEDMELFDQGFALMIEPTLKEPLPIVPSPLPGDRARDEQPGTTAPEPASPLPPEPEKPTGSLPEPEPEQRLLEGELPVRPSARVRGDARAVKPSGTYQLTPRPPVHRYEIISIWRHLRQMRREGPLVDLDVARTIDHICRSGHLQSPVLQARRRNQARLLILVDRHGSMVPFAPMIDLLLESILRGGLLGRTTTYYFRNCPEDFLSPHPSLIRQRPLDIVLAEHATGGSVLVISDAGAAKGRYLRDRAACTRRFLRSIRSHTYRYAWLNPLPADRWNHTTAEDVAEMVPMSPFDREGLIDIVNILRGHPFPPGVRLDE